jgi:uncharacterized protein (DUF3820 family)
MYNDNTPYPIGRYKFTALCRIPAEYLYNLYVNKSYYNKELKEYIETNIESIIQRKEGIITAPPFTFPCDKITYTSESDAKRVLKSIREQEQSHKKPIRAYECNKCGGWHLTSKTIEEYKSKLAKQEKAAP